MIEAHIGMTLIALNTFAGHLPTVFIGAQLIDDAHDHKSLVVE